MSGYPPDRLTPFERREKPFPALALRSIDPAAVEREIDRMERENERAAEEYQARAVAAAQAEHRWKLAEAKIVTVETAQPKGSVSAAERKAIVEHPELHLGYKVTASLLASVDKRIWMIQHGLEALRSLNANVRQQTD